MQLRATTLSVFAAAAITMWVAILAPQASLAARPATRGPVVAPANAELVSAGSVVFQHLCTRCHDSRLSTYDRQGPIPSRMHVTEAQARTIIRNGKSRDGMPAFRANRVSDGDMNALVAYIRSQRGIR